MYEDNFSVTLDKIEGHNENGLETGAVVLRGKPFYREGASPLLDSIEAVIEAGLIHVPTYRLIAGRATADQDDEAWNKWHDSRAERITAYDETGIIGPVGTHYIIHIQNGGLIVSDPKRIRESVQKRTLRNKSFHLSSDQVDTLLDALKREDTEGLRQIVLGGRIAYTGFYQGFLEETSVHGFIRGVDTTYIVVRALEEARAFEKENELHPGITNIDLQRRNPDLIIASGGIAPLNSMLDQALNFGWTEFGSGHEGYLERNISHAVYLYALRSGVNSTILRNWGRSVGVSPSALERFYR